MKRFCLVIILTLLLPVFLLFAEKINVQGTLVGFDNNAMKLGQVHFLEMTDKGYISKDISAGPDGKFNFETEKKSVLNFTFTGTDHKQKILTVFTLPQDNVIPLVIMLSPNNLDRGFTKVSVIGDFNEFDFETGIPMQKQADGSFTAEITKKTDTLIYQILGPFNDPEMRSVNGRQADYFIYDGGGDYRSVIVSKDKKVKITFNPKDFITGTLEPVVSSPDKSIREMLDNQKLFGSYLKNANNAVKEYFEDQNREKFVSELSKSVKNTAGFISQTKNPRVKRAAYFSYFDICSIALRLKEDSLVDKNILSDILNQIPPEDDIWMTRSQDFFTLVEALNNKESELYAEKMIKSLKGYTKTYIQNQLLARKLVKNYKSPEIVNSIITDKTDSTAYIISSALQLAVRNKDMGAKKFYFDMLNKDFKDSKAASMAKREFSDNKAVEIGKQVPNFKLVSLENDKTIFTPESLKGKYVLIDIWATWCGPCVGEMGNIHKAYEKYKDKNFTILSISFDDKPEKVTKFREKKWKMPWNHAFAKGGFDSDIGAAFEVMGIPRPVLLDPTGKIIAMEGSLRGGSLDKTLSEILK